MSDQTKYPARGQQSEDGRYVTSRFGNVYDTTLGLNVKPVGYVPSDPEQAACDMARAMIVVCGALYSENYDHCGACNGCFRLEEKSCPARSYLAAHGDASAWEVK